MEDLKAKLQMSLSELTKTRSSLEKSQTEKTELDRKLKILHNTFEDSKCDFESTIENLQSKVSWYCLCCPVAMHVGFCKFAGL